MRRFYSAPRKRAEATKFREMLDIDILSLFARAAEVGIADGRNGEISDMNHHSVADRCGVHTDIPREFTTRLHRTYCQAFEVARLQEDEEARRKAAVAEWNADIPVEFEMIEEHRPDERAA